MAAIANRPGALIATSIAASYPTDPQVTLAGSCKQITVVNLESTATDTVTVSFDGTSDAGTLYPGILQGFTWDHTAGQKIWLKGVNAPDAQVLVE